MKQFTITLAYLLFSMSSIAQDLPGTWHGVAVAPDNREITFVFNINEQDQGYNTTMSVPTFNVEGISIQKTTLKEDSLHIDGSNLGMNYKGKWNSEIMSFEGVYTEGQIHLKLNLSKGNPEITKLSRPQEPSRPYAYYEEEVSFSNSEDKISLAGTFTRPQTAGKYPAVILISGSGKHDRNASMMTHRPFLVLSDYLTQKGFAVLRYDDRGYGQSSGDFDVATTADFAKDVLSALAYLKTRSDVDQNAIGLVGHSEGGIVAPLAANQSDDVAFIVSLAATGLPGNEIAVAQSKNLRPFPVPDETSFKANVRKALEIVVSDKESEEKRTLLESHNKSYLEPILKSLGATEENISKFIANETQSLLKPWNTYFYKYDPAMEFEKLTIPILAINGAKDIQVDAHTNQNAIRQALEKGNNSNYSIVLLDDHNHLLQVCETGEIREYKEIAQTTSPEVLELISNWISDVTKK